MTLAIGIIGAGVMGAFHAGLLRQGTGGARLAAVCDADAGRAAQAAGGARTFADPQALIADPEVEAVVVASPDATHAGLALACLDARKPVLCEKPLATTAAEALRVVGAEAALGRRLVQVGYMRRFDPGYVGMREAREAGAIGAPVLLHNVHRNARAPDWFTGAMAVTNSFVHEIDASRWLLGSEMVSARVHPGPGGDPLLIVMETDRGELVSTEVFLNARYGYHVHAEIVGREGTLALAAPAATVMSRDGRQGFAFPDTWVPRFAAAYRLQMQAWVDSLGGGDPVGASAWDGFVATAIAERTAAALAGDGQAALALPERPALYGRGRATAPGGGR